MSQRLPFLLGVLALILTGLAYVTFRAVPLRWLVCYAPQLPPQDFKGVDWAIVEQAADNASWKNKKTKFFGYLSIGEADLSRPNASSLVGKSFLIAANPDWPNAYQVDVRHPEWHDILFKEMLPTIAAKFDGVFLDTLDVPIELERSDPVRFKGSRAALIALINEIHSRHPNLMIITNNALSILPEVGTVISAALVEDLYTSYDFQNNRVIAALEENDRIKESALDDFRKRFNKPVLTLFYEDSNSQFLSQRAIMKAQARTYDWYLAPIDLMTIGKVRPR